MTGLSGKATIDVTNSFGSEPSRFPASMTVHPGHPHSGEIVVTDVPAEKRFEAVVDGRVAGRAEYILAGQLIIFSHTEVDSAFEGAGIGGALARHSLDEARRRGLVVMPICPFYQAWIGRHPEYRDLVYRPPASRVTD